MQVTLTRRSMTSFDATRLSSQEERDMLQAIARLDLSYNSIALTKGMQYLGRLTELDVSHNCLETLDHLPLGLRRLNVGHNNLQALSGMVALTQLQWLDCSHNVLSTLAGLPPTNALRVVLASHNRLVSCKGWRGAPACASWTCSRTSCLTLASSACSSHCTRCA
jgi:Leucine-rich repeat (LRR) protein